MPSQTVYDLRSDTITKPTEGMRQAMSEAEVGDDVYSEDPTTNKLEALAAELTGKEKALFVTSGSQANLIALYLNGGRGNEVICAESAHIVQHEIAACTAIAGILPITIDAPRGLLKAQDIEKKIKPTGVYDMAHTSLVEIENTIAGNIYSLEKLSDIHNVAKKHSLLIHMDGARLFNAQVATGISAREYARYCDSVSFCLSKGLGAPVGSMLCGSETFIHKARTLRKMLGSGLRQSGILAAAGIYALEHNVERLRDDHQHAAQIANALSQTNWAKVQGHIQTNIVLFSVEGIPAPTVVKRLGSTGIRATTEGSYVRLVTNLNLNSQAIDEACTILFSFDPYKEVL
jgi:threonine aldolase